MRPEQRAFADGRKPAAEHVSSRALREIRGRTKGRTRSVRRRGDGGTGPGYFRAQADHLRGTGGLGRVEFRPHHHAIAFSGMRSPLVPHALVHDHRWDDKETSFVFSALTE